MGRKTTTAQPQRAKLTPGEMTEAIIRFQKLIKRIEQFEPGDINDRDDSKITALGTAISNTVGKTYPPGSTQFNQYIGASDLDKADFSMMGSTPISQVREGPQIGKNEAIALFKEAITDLKEDLESQSGAQPVTPDAAMAVRDNKSIFVVHGHDGEAKQEVARFIEKAELSPIILHEQASGGSTVIEKLEKHSDVGFAVVLLTPDDEGRSQGGELKPRARQNVIGELFYFLGKLGRDRVCALKKGELEFPSDIAGVLYIDLDPAGGWKMDLLREWKAAGYVVDWEKALQ